MSEVHESAVTNDFDIAETRMRIIDRDADIARALLTRRIRVATLPVGLVPVAAAFVLNVELVGDGGRGPWIAAGYAAGAVLSVLTCSFWLRKITKSHHQLLDLRRLRTQLREAEKSLIAHRIDDDTSRRDIAILKQYRNDVADWVEEYRTGAGHYRRISNVLQIVIITGSIVTTGVTSAAAQVAGFRVAAPFISIVVGIAAGLTGYFKFKERSLNLQQTADAIEHEYQAVELRIRRYRKLPDEREALIEFAEEVERLKEEQSKREQQLEQPPELRVDRAQA